MRKIGIIFLLLELTSILSCSGTYFKYQISEQGNEYVSTEYKNGFQIGRSETTDGVMVAVAGEKTQRDEIALWIWVKNGTDHPINFLPSKIKIIGYSDTEQSKWRVYDPDQYLAKLKQEYDDELLTQAIVGGFVAYNAGKTTVKTNGSTWASAYDNNGNRANAYGQYSSTTKIYDNGAAANEYARQQQMINSNKQNYNAAYNAVENGIIKAVTLYPGQEISGHVMAEYYWNFGSLIDVIIPLDGEKFEITLESQQN